MTNSTHEVWMPSVARVRDSGPCVGEWAVIGITIATLVAASLL